jgi:hypothetical protein
MHWARRTWAAWPSRGLDEIPMVAPHVEKPPAGAFVSLTGISGAYDTSLSLQNYFIFALYTVL